MNRIESWISSPTTETLQEYDERIDEMDQRALSLIHEDWKAYEIEQSYKFDVEKSKEIQFDGYNHRFAGVYPPVSSGLSYFLASHFHENYNSYQVYNW